MNWVSPKIRMPKKTDLNYDPHLEGWSVDVLVWTKYKGFEISYYDYDDKAWSVDGVEWWSDIELIEPPENILSYLEEELKHNELQRKRILQEMLLTF